MRRTVGHTNCNLLTWSAIGAVSMVNYRNHSLRILRAEYHQTCTEFRDIFKVGGESTVFGEGETFHGIKLYSVPGTQRSSFCIRLV